MIKKTLILLKKNPLLIVMPVLFIALILVSELPLMGDINRIMGLSRNMYENMPNSPEIQLRDAIDIMSGALKMGLFGLIYAVLAIIFISGYGNMLAAAVNEGKAAIKVFLYGIKRFTGKVILSFLLLIAVVLGASVVMSIVTTPILMAGFARNGFDPGSIMSAQKTMQIVIQIIMLFLYPFIVMWLPAIFIEREEGVTACFRRGVRAGVRNYLPMVVVVLFILLPTLCIYIFTDIYSMFETKLYLLMFLYQALALPVISAYLFVRYGEMKAQLRNRSISV